MQPGPAWGRPPTLENAMDEKDMEKANRTAEAIRVALDEMLDSIQSRWGVKVRDAADAYTMLMSSIAALTVGADRGLGAKSLVALMRAVRGGEAAAKVLLILAVGDDIQPEDRYEFTKSIDTLAARPLQDALRACRD